MQARRGEHGVRPTVCDESISPLWTHRFRAAVMRCAAAWSGVLAVEIFQGMKLGTVAAGWLRAGQLNAKNVVGAV